MWTYNLVLVMYLVSASGQQDQNMVYKGCFSTSFVQQYTFYYRSNHSYPIKESIAFCNNRLTTHIGLQFDFRLVFSTPVPHFVYDYFAYCGNDLVDVSPQANSSHCPPCEDNDELFCGENGFMSVYLLRESTPFALLVTTVRGVEMFTYQTTTLLVPYNSDSEYKYVDYIYTEDMIVSFVDTQVLRSFYNPSTMTYTDYHSIMTQTYCSRSLALDIIERMAYHAHCLGRVFRINLTSKIEQLVIGEDYNSEDLSVDPFDRFMIFIQLPNSNIIWSHTFKNGITIEHSLEHFHVDSIQTLALDYQEKIIYAITTLKGNNTSYLISLDYEMSQLRVLFSGPLLVNATTLEVFDGDAVWLKTDTINSVIYRCTLTPRCSSKNLISYKINQKIYDFTIYHQLRQTPGEKRLCTDMSCEYGCKAFSPFSARCTCPAGMKLNQDNSTCSNMLSTPTATTVTSTTTYFQKTTFSHDVTTTFVLPSSTIQPTTVPPSNNNNGDSGWSLFEVIVVICIVLILVLLVVIMLLITNLYKVKSQGTCDQNHHELNEISKTSNQVIEAPLISY